MSKRSRLRIAWVAFGLLTYLSGPAAADVTCIKQADCDASQYCNKPWPQCMCIEWHNKVQNPTDAHLCWPVNKRAAARRDDRAEIMRCRQSVAMRIPPFRATSAER